MKLIVKTSSETYLAANGKEYNYKNYYLLLDNGRYIAIKPAFVKDYATLALLAEIIE